MSISEAKVEARFKAAVELVGGKAYKFVSPGCNGVPDRLALYPIPPEHREIVSRYVRFVEVKAPGRKPKPGQRREHAKLSELGFRVEVVDR